MGRGPAHLVEHGAIERLSDVGGRVDTREIEFNTDFPIEMATTFGVLRAIAGEVRQARKKGDFPMVLSGSCNSTAGALASFSDQRLGLIWFDAHGDFHTPETTTSGFMGGLPLSIVVGHCWQTLAASIPGFTPMPESRVVMIGLRDVDPGEAERFAASEITTLYFEQLRANGVEAVLRPVLESLQAEVDGLYLHLDLDVFDQEVAPVNPYQVAGGMSVEEVENCCRLAVSLLPIVGASVTAYDPTSDPSGKGMAASLDAIALLGSLGRQGTSPE
jgi:arginase